MILCIYAVMIFIAGPSALARLGVTNKRVVSRTTTYSLPI